MRCYGSPKRHVIPVPWGSTESCRLSLDQCRRHRGRLICPRWHRHWVHCPLSSAWCPATFSSGLRACSSHFPQSYHLSPQLPPPIVSRSPYWTVAEPPLHPGTGNHAVFTDSEANISPELFSRAGGDIHIAGLDTTSPCPRKLQKSNLSLP